MTPRNPRLLIGRYLLVERIAAGGMGEVWVGLQQSIGRFSRPIAVKLLLPHLVEDERSVNMFLTEARVGARMSHANIAQVFDVGLDGDRYFIAMELVPGVALQKLIGGLREAHEEVSLDVLSYIGRSVCEGLHVAHEQRGEDGQSLELVHRDVTPHNVLIGVDGAVKLTDFGIARVADADRLSRPGLLMGKLGYFAPEQITGQAIDRRVDLFALGATLYHLAALQKPFDTPMGATLDPTRLPTVPLRVCRPDLPRALIEAIECAMSVSPDSRFATAKAFRNALPVPGPDVADELARLVRRVCPAALFELEAKTERASTLAIETEKTAAPVAQTSVSDAAAVRAAVGSPYRSAAAALVIAALIVGGLLVVRSPPTAEPLAAPPAPAADPPPVEVLDAGPAAISVNVTPVVDAGSTVLRPASLTVDATPWASLTLDGQPLGDTPRAEVPLTRGAHLLVATCPETGKTVRKRFVAGSGERVVMRLDLR